MYVLLCLTAVCLFLMYAVFHWNKERRRLLQLAALTPIYKGMYPIVGHAYRLLGDSTHFWDIIKEVSNAARDVGGVLGVWLGTNLQFIINDPDDSLTLLNTCIEKNDFYRMGMGWVGEGLIVSRVPIWKRHRKLMNPTFSQHVLDGFLYVFNTQSKILVKDLLPFVGKGEFDPRPQLTDQTLETVCQTAVGITLDDKFVFEKGYKEAAERMFDLMAYRVSNVWLHPDWIYNMTSGKREELKYGEILHNMSRNVLKKRKSERKNNKTACVTSRRFIAFLDLLLDLEEEGMFTDHQIREELDTIIAAGYDTSSRAMLYALILIGSSPEIQEKMYDEIMSVMGTKTDVEKDDLQKLVYIEAVVKESLRIHAVTPIVARNVDKEVKLKNYTLPAGSGVVISFWGIHRLPIWGPDPEQFRPERWLEPDTLPQSPGAYCAFSLGKRNCIGKSYALMSLKTTLTHVIRKYRIKADHNKLKVKFEVLLKPVSGYEISLELR